MQTPLLMTKLTVPAPRPNLVTRRRLLDRLTRALDRRLTLVSAPAGFGKTTLLAEWVAGIATPVAWLSLDQSDNDLTRFFRYLVAGLQTLAPGIGQALLAVQPGPEASALEGPLSTFLNELGPASPLVLVLDDYHLISADAIHRALTFVIEHLPAAVHVVIATRADPPLPLARLRVRGQLNEVRAPDLQFSPEEAHAFFNDTMQVGLDFDHSTALHARTEGWVAGLQLAGLSLRGRQDVAGFLGGFAGSNRYILDYLVEEVLSRQSPEVQTFLQRTSILSRLNGPLCDAVSQAGSDMNGQTVLANLEASNVFTLPMDDERRWYRYHHLFADCLQSRLKRESPELLPELHLRAASWYSANGLEAEAVEHALQARDSEFAAGLIEACAFDLIVRSEHATLRRWLETLPGSVTEQRAALCVFYGWVLLETTSDMESAARWLELPADTALTVELREIRALLRAEICFLRGEFAQAESIVDQAFGADNATSADRTGPAETGRAYLRMGAATVVGEGLRAQGRLRRAMAVYENAIRRVEHTPLDARLLAAMGHAELRVGWVLYELNDVQAAGQRIERGIELVHKAPNETYEALGCMFLASVRQAQGRNPEAIQLLDRAEHSARRRNSTGELVWYGATRAKLARIQGNLGACASWVQEYEPSVDGKLAGRERMVFILELADTIYARVLLGLGRNDEAARLIEKLLERSESTGHTFNLIENLVVGAQIWQGDTSRALAALERAVVLARPEGYVRTFVDEGPPMADLLRALSRQSAYVGDEYIQSLLGAFGEQREQTPPPSTVNSPAKTVVEALSARELEVLKLLEAGLLNRQIADELVVSVGTVKRHTANIYAKLRVDGRAQAILRARSLGLL